MQYIQHQDYVCVVIVLIEHSMYKLNTSRTVLN